MGLHSPDNHVHSESTFAATTLTGREKLKDKSIQCILLSQLTVLEILCTQLFSYSVQLYQKRRLAYSDKSYWFYLIMLVMMLQPWMAATDSTYYVTVGLLSLA